MLRRLLTAALGVTAMTFVMSLYAAQTPDLGSGSGEVDVKKIKEKLTVEQQILDRQFRELEDAMLRLKQRLENSQKEGDQRKAKQLQKVLDRAKDAAISVRIKELVDFLKKDDFSNIAQVREAMEKSRRLADQLRELIALLQQDDAQDLTERRKHYEKLLEKIKQIINDEKTVQAKTKNNLDDAKRLQDAQAKVRNDTNQVAKELGKLAGDKGDGKGGETKGDGKSEAKSEGKGDGNKGDGKGGEAKAGDSKGGEAKGGEAQQGEAKGGDKSGQGGEKSGEPGKGKAGEKSGDGQPSGAKGGEKSGGQGGEKGGSKSGGEGSKSGSKSGGQGGEKSGSKSGGDGQKGGDKDGQKSSVKQKGDKGGEKQGDAKSGGQQGGSKAGEKSGKQAGGQGQAKSGQGAESGSKSGGSKSGGQGGKSGSQSKSGGQQGGDQGGDQGGKQGGDQGDEQQQAGQAKKRVQDSEEYQKSAENKIGQKKNNDAVKDQDKAIEELEKAKKKLEDLLRQLREEELERLLAALQARCERMLAMQIRVREDTVALDKLIESRPDKKPNQLDKNTSYKLSDEEKKIVVEANKAIEMLEAEGSAVAFPEVFKQVREDMKNVARRLEVTDAGKVTIAIEDDIINTLKEMIEALKKAQQDLQQSKSDGKGGKQGQPQDQKLLDLIAELKMIRAMQMRVNNRTEAYGRQYQGEQANDPQIRRELRNLADRQERIFEVTKNLAKGDNR